jgi:quercetin dioxygenase-like cupin family protein
MADTFFPGIITNLPQADINWDGIYGWTLTGEHGQVVFMKCDVRAEVGEHTHGEQFGFVLDGSAELTVEGKKITVQRGDAYHIPAGAVHSAVLSPGFKVVDVFEEPDRYKVKS